MQEAAKQLDRDAEAARDRVGTLEDELETACAATAKAHARLGRVREDRAAAIDAHKRYRRQIRAVEKQCALLRKQQRTYKDQQHDLMEVVTQLHECVVAAAEHARLCRTRGYFYKRAAAQHSAVKRAFDSLVILTTSISKTAPVPDGEDAGEEDDIATKPFLCACLCHCPSPRK